jgi:hypothetical protein
MRNLREREREREREIENDTRLASTGPEFKAQYYQ